MSDASKAPIPVLRDPSLAASRALGAALSLWLSVAYGLMLVAGIVVLRSPGATISGNEMSFPRAVFTTINAATLTGFQQSIALDDLGRNGLAYVLALTVGGTLFALIVGGIALVHAIRLPYTDGQVIRSALVTWVLGVACGTAIIAEPGRSLLSSAAQAASALGNSGLTLGRLPAMADWRTHVALLPLALLGGLSVPVLMELVDFTRRRHLSRHTWIVLTLSAATYLAGVAASRQSTRRPARESRGIPAVVTGSALSLNARTCGFPLVSIGEMSRQAQWLLMVLMLIGAAPGGAGGGMKVTALFHIYRGSGQALARAPGMRITGIAATWVVLYVLIVLATLIGLLATVPELPPDRLVFLAVSAVGCVGLSHDPVAITAPAVSVLASAMLVGRLAPLVVLWWTARTTDDADVGVG